MNWTVCECPTHFLKHCILCRVRFIMAVSEQLTLYNAPDIHLKSVTIAKTSYRFGTRASHILSPLTDSLMWPIFFKTFKVIGFWINGTVLILVQILMLLLQTRSSVSFSLCLIGFRLYLENTYPVFLFFCFETFQRYLSNVRLLVLNVIVKKSCSSKQLRCHMQAKGKWHNAVLLEGVNSTVNWTE